MASTKARRSYALVPLAVVMLFGALLGAASAQDADDTYTGCLTSGGTINKVAIGNEPASPCRGNSVEISWNAQGPKGDQGDPGPEGPKGDKGDKGDPGEVPASTDAVGGGQAHGIVQPSLTVNCIIALQGVYPSRDGVLESRGTDPFLGEIAWFAGNFAPRGWAFCDGQLLSISQYSALFSLLGTTYGGDGRTTFALPDARGRVIVHEGNGPGLTDRRLGEKFGAETETLTVPEMPSHSHGITP